MKYDFIDESKIIKKTGENNGTNNGFDNNSISNDISNINDGSDINNSNNNSGSNNNNDKNISSNNINNNTTSNNNIDNNITITNDEINNNVIKNDMPVFVFGKSNGKTYTKTEYQERININIPKDQLQLIYVNTIKLINELQLDLALLKEKMKFDNDQFYKNKYMYFSKELEYNLYKKEQIEKIK